MIKPTPQLLNKLEEVFSELGYKVRYEKGNFKSGYCILESQKVVLLNKYSVIESRIAILFEILKSLTSKEEFNGEIFVAFRDKYLKDLPTQNIKEKS